MTRTGVLSRMIFGIFPCCSPEGMLREWGTTVKQGSFMDTKKRVILALLFTPIAVGGGFTPAFGDDVQVLDFVVGQQGKFSVMVPQKADGNYCGINAALFANSVFPAGISAKPPSGGTNPALGISGTPTEAKTVETPNLFSGDDPACNQVVKIVVEPATSAIQGDSSDKTAPVFKKKPAEVVVGSMEAVFAAEDETSAVRYTIDEDDLPAGVSFDSERGTFSLTDESLRGRVFEDVDVTATDGAGNTTSYEFNLRVPERDEIQTPDFPSEIYVGPDGEVNLKFEIYGDTSGSRQANVGGTYTGSLLAQNSSPRQTLKIRPSTDAYDISRILIEVLQLPDGLSYDKTSKTISGRLTNPGGGEALLKIYDPAFHTERKIKFEWQNEPSGGTEIRIPALQGNRQVAQAHPRPLPTGSGAKGGATIKSPVVAGVNTPAPQSLIPPLAPGEGGKAGAEPPVLGAVSPAGKYSPTRESLAQTGISELPAGLALTFLVMGSGALVLRPGRGRHRA